MTNAKHVNFQAYFTYDHGTGVLIRRSTGKPAYVQLRKKKDDRQPYGEVKIEGRKYAAHRVVWAVVHGEWPDGMLDHINRDTLDNRIENLRVATPAVNAKNKSRAKNNTSGQNGIDFSSGGWRVRVGTVFGGRYSTLELAMKVRDLLYRELGYTDDHGE
jgi:hypothetical protein